MVKMEEQKKSNEAKVSFRRGGEGFRMKLKICGMKNPENIREVAELRPDYMGFIFYEKSPRFVEDEIPVIDKSIRKTGVFVNASLDFIRQKIEAYDLKAVQLHGQESPEFCQKLKSEFSVEIIKAFSIQDTFDFSELEIYLPVVDFFLFDTKGKRPGGNGISFNWEILEQYSFQKPFFLSGGIGLDELNAIRTFQQKNLPLYGIDINSKFETEPGQKNSETIKGFKKQLI
jgi:phosphoribosylanthranilate isomerase